MSHATVRIYHPFQDERRAVHFIIELMSLASSNTNPTLLKSSSRSRCKMNDGEGVGTAVLGLRLTRRGSPVLHPRQSKSAATLLSFGRLSSLCPQQYLDRTYLRDREKSIKPYSVTELNLGGQGTYRPSRIELNLQFRKRPHSVNSSSIDPTVTVVVSVARRWSDNAPRSDGHSYN